MKISNLKQEHRVAIVGLLITAAIVAAVVWRSERHKESKINISDEISTCDYEGNVLHLKLKGDIVPYDGYSVTASDGSAYSDPTVPADQLVETIHRAAGDENVKGLLLDIDSPGGSPVAADEIASAVKSFGKPSVAVIHELGTSAAYWIASAADRIIANRISDVGSIGVTASYLETAGKNQREGIIYHDLSVGKFKNAGDPNRQLKPEEQAILQDQLEKIYEVFVNTVAMNRKIDLAEVKKIADGSDMLGEEALRVKLIDALGGDKEGLEWLSTKIDTPISLCDYNQN